MFFRLSSFELGLLIFGIVLGTTFLGVVVGRRLRAHADALREPFGVLQAALLGLVALILAFGLTLAVGRYDARRAAVVETANAIGTTYLRAQTLREPMRTRSLERLVRYTDATIHLSESVPGTEAADEAIADGLDRPVRGLVTVPDTPLVKSPQVDGTAPGRPRPTRAVVLNTSSRGGWAQSVTLKHRDRRASVWDAARDVRATLPALSL